MMRLRGRTESPRSLRNAALAAVLLYAALLRLWHLDFGLPALNDPDEPIFVLTALDMLRGMTLNPGWFGHPATLLFYLLSIVIVGVAAAGTLAGTWANQSDFVAAVFSDPAILVLPMRGLSVGAAILGIWLTWLVGRRVGGTALGLSSALLLAANPLHVDLSQVIRTDMLATALMTWCLLHALAIADGGGRRHLLLSGIAAGLACATKWPAILVAVAPVCAILATHERTPALAYRVLLPPVVAIATLLIVSPYILIDWPVVIRDLNGEARPIHLGATGHGLVRNAGWYIDHALRGSFGLAGVALVAIGTVDLARRRPASLALLPFGLLFLAALSAQSLVWERWFVPLLPLAAVLAANGAFVLAGLLRPPLAQLAVASLLLLGMVGGMTATAAQRIGDRTNDPRQAATKWALANVPPGKVVLVESAAFDLLAYHGRIIFLFGNAGCVDARQLLADRPTHREGGRRRAGKAIVDLGHVEADKLPTCVADYYILSNHGRYLKAAASFPGELAIYRELVGRATRVFVAGDANASRRAEGRMVEIYGRDGGRPTASSGRSAAPSR